MTIDVLYRCIIKVDFSGFFLGQMLFTVLSLIFISDISLKPKGIVQDTEQTNKVSLKILWLIVEVEGQC